MEMIKPVTECAGVDEEARGCGIGIDIRSEELRLSQV